jgi:predicted GTPase
MRVQRFATLADIDASHPTVEEREEYELPVELGMVMYAGVDYAEILEQAQDEADVIVWDGGNNDFPFFRPDLLITVVDPLRAGHELKYHPGETNLRMADVLVVSKVDSAPAENVERVIANARRTRPEAPVLLAALEVGVDEPLRIAGRRVVVVEDGPTLTHGGMAFGAGTVAARRYGAAEVVDARPFAVGAVAEAFRSFPHLQGEVPAVGYGERQVADLEATLNAVPADVVLDATPVALRRLLRLDKPIVEVSYRFEERGAELPKILERFEREGLGRPPRPAVP